MPAPEEWSSRLLILHPDFAPFDSARDDEAKPATDRMLDAGVAVAGTVVDERGRPVAGAIVWMEDSLPWPMARTAADGTFQVAHAPRTWERVRARTRSLTGSVPRRPGRISVVVRAGRLLSGTVRDAASGRPLAGASVSVADGSGGRLAALTDAAGVYRFEALDAGRYYVVAVRPGYAMDPKGGGDPVDLRAAAQARHDVAAAPAARGQRPRARRSGASGRRRHGRPGHQGPAHLRSRSL